MQKQDANRKIKNVIQKTEYHYITVSMVAVIQVLVRMSARTAEEYFFITTPSVG